MSQSRGYNYGLLRKEGCVKMEILIISKHLTRQVNIPAWKYHLGHAAIGALIYCFLYSIGLENTAVYAVLFYPWLKKIYQWYMQGLPDWKDAIGDWAQHQVIFVFVLLKNGNYHIGFIALIGIIAIYLGTLQYQRP